MPHRKLNERQMQVLIGIANDQSLKEIAHKLKVSHKTVEFHWRKLRLALGIKTQVAAALYAHRHNIK